MKKRILALLTVCVIALCSLVSCFGTVADEGSVTVVIENRDGSFKEYKVSFEDVEKKDEGAAGVLEYLASLGNDPLTVDMHDSSYGKYINSIGTLVPDGASGEYISVYTSVEEDFGTFDGVCEIDYNGVTLKNSGKGVSYMQVVEGAVILFRVEVYSW